MRMMLTMVMKSGLYRLAILLFLCSSVSALGSVVSKGYRYIDNHYTWQDAQQHCKSLNTELATIYSQSDSDGLFLEYYYAWVGYRRDYLWPHYWDWADHTSHTPKWGEQQNLSSTRCACIHYPFKRLYRYSCDEHRFFYCLKHSSEYTFIPESKTWSEAKHYCEAKFDHLAFFPEDSDLEKITERDFPVWIGLHRDGQEWKWSCGHISEYRKWESNESSSNGDCVTISSLSKQMAARDCNARFPFICYLDNVVLVKENKTWEQALEHCRNLVFGGRHDYDLVSVQPGEDHSYLMNRIMEGDTEKVWVGLRFLAGEWLWVNGAILQYTNLPTCPIEGKHCAAMSRNNTGDVETADCMGEYNFLCYRPA